MNLHVDKATDQSTEKPSVLAELQRVQAKRLQTSDKEKPKQKARDEFSR